MHATFVEKLHDDGRITDEEMAGLHQEIEKPTLRWQNSFGRNCLQILTQSFRHLLQVMLEGLHSFGLTLRLSVPCQ